MANLKEFRRGVVALKKQGLLGGSKIDARKAVPDMKVRGKRLDTLIRKYDDVISGKLSAVKVPSSELKKFRKAGFETTQGRVLVPHTKSEKATVKGGKITIRAASGVERVPIPVEFHNLKQYLTDLKKNASLIDRMKTKNEYFGIRFRGGQRANFYSNVELLIADLSRYESISQAYGRKAKEMEIYENLEIVRMNYKSAVKLEHEISERKRVHTKAYNRRHAKRVRERIKGKSTTIQDQYRRKSAERMKDYRKRMMKDKTRYSAYLATSRKRAAKSSKKRNAKKRRKTKSKGKK